MMMNMVFCEQSLLHSDDFPSEFCGYHVQSTIAKGQYGMLHLVEKDGNKYCMKIMLDKSASKSFQTEIRCAKLLSHPNIPKIVQVIVNLKHEYALIFEFVKGVTLYNLYSQRDFIPFAFPEVDMIFRSVTNTLAYIHSLGIIHGDLKPDNIMVDCSTEEWGVSVIDFGLASVIQEPFLQTTRYVGSQNYMAPEIALAFETNSPYDGQKADIFSFGVLLYNMIFADFPDVSQTATTTLRSHLPRAWGSLLTAMISFHPELRPSAEKIQRLLFTKPRSGRQCRSRADAMEGMENMEDVVNEREFRRVRSYSGLNNA